MYAIPSFGNLALQVVYTVISWVCFLLSVYLMFPRVYAGIPYHPSSLSPLSPHSPHLELHLHLYLSLFIPLLRIEGLPRFYSVPSGMEAGQGINLEGTGHWWPLVYLGMFDQVFSALLNCLPFSHSVMSDSLWSRGLQHNRLRYPSLSPGVCSDLCILSWWCHPTISSSVAPFSSCPQSFPVSGSFSELAKGLELWLQYQCVQWIFRVDFFWDWPIWSPCCPRDSQESSH